MLVILTILKHLKQLYHLAPATFQLVQVKFQLSSSALDMETSIGVQTAFDGLLSGLSRKASRNGWVISNSDLESQSLLNANRLMDVPLMLSDVACAPAALQVSAEKQTLVRAAEAMIELHQVQSECVEANCGLPPVHYDGFIRMCLALPPHDQLRLFNQQIDALLQACQRNLQKQTQASPPHTTPVTPAAVPQAPLASVLCAPRTEISQTPVTPAANAVHAGPRVLASLREGKRDQLIHSNASVGVHSGILKARPRPHRAQTTSAQANAEREPGSRSRRSISQGYECWLFKSRKYM